MTTPLAPASGQVIDGVRISTTRGACIVVNAGVTNVTIQNSDIGPCGSATQATNDDGVLVVQNASNVTIRGNVIHEVASGVQVFSAAHPITVDRNTFWGMRGPYPAGQAVIFHSVGAGGGAGFMSHITCNVSDATYGSTPKSYEDHINLLASNGSANAPIEVAYNRVRGGTSKTGGGITVGDQGGSWEWIHDNVVLAVANSGIGVAGGSNILVENNRVDQRGASAASLTYYAYYVNGISTCSNVTLRGNHGIARLWNWNQNVGTADPGYAGAQSCANVADTSNFFGDSSLAPTLFSQAISACL